MAQYSSSSPNIIRVGLIAVMLLTCTSVFGKDIVVYSTEGPLQGYLDLITERPNFLDDSKPLLVEESQRAVSEIRIFHQAVLSSGLGVSLKLKPESTNMRRAFLLAQKGRMISFTETYSHEDIVDKRDTFYISQAVLRENEYPVGLYSSVENHRALNATPGQLNQLSAASHPEWHTDWRILEAIGVKKIYPVESMVDALNLVAHQKVDIVLRAFHRGEGFVYTYKQQKFAPILGIKVFFPDSRHFLVSRRHPDGERLFEALEMGLSKMRQRGEIEKIYQRFGVMDPRVSDWRVVNKAK